MVADELASMIDDDEPARSKGMLANRSGGESQQPSLPTRSASEPVTLTWKLKAIQKIEVMLRPSQLW